MSIIEKVGIYCRLSDEDRFKVNKNDDSDSIINQKSMCIKYAKLHGWNVIDVYSDDDFSGAGTYRPEFERLINDCKSGKINLVLCKTQSRFSRDMEIIEKYLHNKFIEWNVRFISIVDNADTSIESNKKSRQINGLINEWYLEDLSRNIKRSLKNKREDGLFVGSFAPYGYMKSSENKYKLVIDLVASKVVKDIFKMYENGYGYNKISKYLNSCNILPPSLYKKQNGSKYISGRCNYNNICWTSNTISKILRNEVYIGNLVQGKKTSLGYKIHKFKKLPKTDWCCIENAHEPIIDIDTWNNVQKRLLNHEKPINNGNIHYLSKKVYCMNCNEIFTRNVYNVKNKKRSYLQCKGAKKMHICKNNSSIKLDDLEIILLNEINKFIDKYYNFKILKEKYNLKKNINDKNNYVLILEKEKINLEKKINNLKKYYKNLYEKNENLLISDEMFKVLSNDYNKEISFIKNRIFVINNDLCFLNNKIQDSSYINIILDKYKKIEVLNKIIIDEFIKKINIGIYDKKNKTRDIEIEWKF